jgi:hypothetical protein
MTGQIDDYREDEGQLQRHHRRQWLSGSARWIVVLTLFAFAIPMAYLDYHASLIVTAHGGTAYQGKMAVWLSQALLFGSLGLGIALIGRGPARYVLASATLCWLIFAGDHAYSMKNYNDYNPSNWDPAMVNLTADNGEVQVNLDAPAVRGEWLTVNPQDKLAQMPEKMMEMALKVVPRALAMEASMLHKSDQNLSKAERNVKHLDPKMKAAADAVHATTRAAVNALGGVPKNKSKHVTIGDGDHE